MREGSLPYLVRLLQSANHKIQEQAAGTLRNLAVNGWSKDPIPYLASLGRPLCPVNFLADCSEPYLTQFFALSLLPSDDNKMKIVQEGALPHLIGLLRSSHDSVLIQAAGSVRNLSVSRPP